MKKRFPSRVESLISSLRGLPETSTKLKEKGTKQLDSILESCIERFHIGKHTPEETIQNNWERIVGAQFAKRCQPERIDNGTLLIQVPNATLRRELLFMESRILTAVGSLPDCQHIHRIALKSGH